MDLLYVRCAEQLIERARIDRQFAVLLMGGGGGAHESIDIGRAQDRMFRALGGADWLDHSDWHESWFGLALSGGDWLHAGIDTGYGTPRFLLAADVKAIAAELEPIPIDAICGADATLLYHLTRWRQFYLAAAADGHAVIVTPE